MSAGSVVYTDLPAFISTLRGTREPTFAVLGPPLSGKSTFARRLAAQEGIVYLDILDYIHGRPDLASTIDIINPPALRQLILEYVARTVAGVLLVDEADFLLHSWGDDLVSFQEMVRKLAAPGRQVVFGFFLRTQPSLDGWRMVTSGGRARVLRFEELRPLPEGG